jgi:hypothetical protein
VIAPDFGAAVVDAERRVEEALQACAERFRVACAHDATGDYEDWETLMETLHNALRVLRWLEEKR